MFVDFSNTKDILFAHDAPLASKQEWEYALDYFKDKDDGAKLSCYETTDVPAQDIPLSHTFIRRTDDVCAISHDKKRYLSRNDDEAKNIAPEEWAFAKKKLWGKNLNTKLRAFQKQYKEVTHPITQEKFLLQHHFIKINGTVHAMEAPGYGKRGGQRKLKGVRNKKGGRFVTRTSLKTTLGFCVNHPEFEEDCFIKKDQPQSLIAKEMGFLIAEADKQLTPPFDIPAPIQLLKYISSMNLHYFFNCLAEHFSSTEDAKDKTRSQIIACQALLLMIDAVITLHQKNIIHRDLKLNNVLIEVNETDTPIRATICDYDTSVKSEIPFTTPYKLGNPEDYMAPEIAKKDHNNLRHYSKASDIFAVGKIIEKAAGVVELTSPLQTVITQLTKEDPALRTSLENAKKEISAVLQRLATPVQPAPLSPKRGPEFFSPVVPPSLVSSNPAADQARITQPLLSQEKPARNMCPCSTM